MEGGRASDNGAGYLALLADRQILGWAMYDWANSAFSTIVVSSLLGPYLSAAASNGGGIVLFSFQVEPDSIYPFFVSLSVVLQIFLLPVFGAFADLCGCRKRLLVAAAVAGSLFTCLLSAAAPSIVAMGLLFVLANVFFGVSAAVYNSFLAFISPPRLRDRVSCLGWAAGYLGGGLALALCLILFSVLDRAQAARAGFALAGLWWLSFTLLFPARSLREPENGSGGAEGFQKTLRQGVGTTLAILKEMPAKRPEAWKFLVSYFFYNDGVQTVIAVASVFAVSSLGVGADTLLLLMLFIQFVAVFGSMGFGWLGERLGTKRAIMLSLAIWTAITLYACLFLQDVQGLFVLGFFVAMVLGGTQALSRSLFSEMIPSSSQSQYFGFYEVSEKGSSWLGPLVFAVAVQLTGSSRAAMGTMAGFFLIGMVLLWRVRHEREAHECSSGAESA